MVGSRCCRRLSPSCRCLNLHHGHVSSPRSPNPPCGFPATGSPVGPCRSHTGRFVIGGNGATTSAARTSRVAPLPLLPDRCRSRRQAGPRLAAVARSPPLPRGPTVVPLRFRMRWFQRSRTQTGVLGQATPGVLRTFPHPSSPEAPSLHRNYPASPVLRASPPPRRPRLALTGSRLTRATPPAGLPVLLPSPSCPHATAITPAEPVGACVARFPAAGSHRAFLRRVGFRITRFEACSAFAHAVACGLAESPNATL